MKRLTPSYQTCGMWLMLILVLMTYRSGGAQERSATGVRLPEVVAHRGASFDAPENTRASVKLAWKQQTDAVEIDIFLTADKKIVVTHDKTPKRFGGPDRLISDMTWEELRTLDVGTWKDPRWHEETMPRLEEILPLTPEGKRLFIEIKAGPEIVPHLKALLEASGQSADRQTIIAFSQEVVAEVRKQLPHFPTYWLVSIKERNGNVEPTSEEIIRIARELDIPGVDIGGAIHESLVKDLKAAGLEVHAWTINDPERARELVSWGVQSITTDKPALMLESLKPGSR